MCIDLPQEDYLFKRNAQEQMNQAFLEGKKILAWQTVDKQ